MNCHSIREALDTCIISLPRISSDLQIADIFTKVMTGQRISSDLQIADIFTKVMTGQRHQFFIGKLMFLDRYASF
jgi:ribosome-binding factor A